MRSIKWFLALALAFGLALGSLASAQERMGAWPDLVVFTSEPNRDNGILQLQVGVFDFFIGTGFTSEHQAIIDADDALTSNTSFGSYAEITFNPSGPTFQDGRLNPFSVPRVREAMNWLIDRDFLAQEIYDGLALPRYFPVTAAFPDYARYVDLVRALELEYAYDPARAEAVITEEMEKLGATKVGGVWNHNGAPVVINVLIRSEDARRLVGDYISNKLEDIGFTVDRLYRPAADASPLWISADPTLGLMHVYTGGWITTAIARDQGSNWDFFYTPRGLSFALWQGYKPSPEFDDVAERLAVYNFNTLEERRELFERALRLGMEDSVRVWTVDQLSFTPLRAEVESAYDLAGSIQGTPLWALTMRKTGVVGGRIDIGITSLLTEPWNPVAGSNWIFDQMPIRGTQGRHVILDPYTGLNLPNRVDRAEVVVREGLPIGVTYDWVDLSFTPTVEVPGDAWVDWDATAQRWITADEKFPEGLTAERVARVFYQADLFDKVAWHDGSPFSVGDILMSMILAFDRAKPESAIYDSNAVPAFNSFLANHKGYRIVSADPLVIEAYSDTWNLDAENMVTQLPFWPLYAQGEGAWHTLALGVLAEADEQLAFGSAKADTLGVEWMSMLDGPSIGIFDRFLAQAQTTGYVPYAAAIEPYLADGEAAARYANLASWRAAKGHYWVNTGPLQVQRAFSLEGTLVLERNPNYPDPASKWEGFGAPRLAQVEVDGPARVTIGSDATFQVYVSFQDEAYPAEDIGAVSYLVLDATGAIELVGEAVLVAPGMYEVSLSADATNRLVVGSNRLEVAVAPIVVSIPSFDSLEFVTTR